MRDGKEVVEGRIVRGCDGVCYGGGCVHGCTGLLQRSGVSVRRVTDGVGLWA